jgi:hypothetical protein
MHYCARQVHPSVCPSVRLSVIDEKMCSLSLTAVSIELYFFSLVSHVYCPVTSMQRKEVMNSSDVNVCISHSFIWLLMRLVKRLASSLNNTSLFLFCLAAWIYPRIHNVVPNRIVNVIGPPWVPSVIGCYDFHGRYSRQWHNNTQFVGLSSWKNNRLLGLAGRVIIRKLI